MRFGLDVAQHQLTWDALVERVRLAEDAGLDGVWVFDHFKALYADPRGPSLEAWTLLAGLARETSRVRLGTLVTGMTHRHPSVLAAEVVTVDHLSRGRVE
jgi:alkanesulfonate monooxygenase SsuD/methylene tetrahydromethanopterin reductase-like flavin-dependent oxidoreductase (luciferase family)